MKVLWNLMKTLLTFVRLSVCLVVFFGTAFRKFLTLTLTHSFSMHSFSNLWKYQKTVGFSDVFRGWRKGALGTNGLRSRDIIFLKKWRRRTFWKNLYSRGCGQNGPKMRFFKFNEKLKLIIFLVFCISRNKMKIKWISLVLRFF